MGWSPRGAVVALLCCALALAAIPAGAAPAPPTDGTTDPVRDSTLTSEQTQTDHDDSQTDRDRTRTDRERGQADRDRTRADRERDRTDRSSEHVVVTYEYRLTPDSPGEIDVALSASMPSGVSSLSVTLPPNATVRNVTGFTTEGTSSTLEWENGSAAPSAVFSVPVDETATFRGIDRYVSVDAGPWALVDPPSASVGASGEGGIVSVEERATTAGPGYVTDSVLYLGPYETHNATVSGASITLVEPGAASLAESPSAVLDAFAGAAERFRFADTSDGLVVIAAPRPDDDWAFSGRAWSGAGDGPDTVLVVDDRPLGTVDNVWVHEYVHAVQPFETTTETYWLVEAIADYYAAADALGSGRVDFDQFRAQLDRGTSIAHEQAVLSEPRTWGRLTDYQKGALVVGELDRRIRLATDGERTFADVMGQFSPSFPVSLSAFLERVEEVGNESVRRAAERYVTTNATPSPWSADAHAAAFGDRFGGVDRRLDTGNVTVTGPYRTDTLRGRPYVVGTNETVTVTVSVRNLGDSGRSYRLPLVVDNETVAEATGRVGAGETVRVTLNRTFETPGTDELRVFDDSLSVTVERPPVLAVTDFSANRTNVTGGGAVTLSATVRNVGTGAANSTLVFGEGFDTVASREVSLRGGAQTTVTATVTPSEPGTYEYYLEQGDSVSVAVDPATAAETPTPTETDIGETTGEARTGRTATTSDGTPVTADSGATTRSTGGSGPGFGPGLVLVAMLALVLVGRRR